MNTSFKAMEAGAVAVLEKPRGIGHPDSERLGQELIRQVKLMNEVKVVTRWPRHRSKALTQQTPPQKVAGHAPTPRGEIRLIAIGTSTGGPPVLQSMLTTLSKQVPVPIVIVQHIAKGFLPGMASWLEQSTGFPVHLATHGERLLPGHVYFGPDDVHLEVNRAGRAQFNNDPPDKGLRPSVTHLFASVANNYRAHAIGVLLTGMGADGSSELKLMRDVGAITISQDKASSLVHGMPGEAIKLQAADYILSPADIVVTIEKLLNITN
jgi:two-component system chemotaxis response regulator CheB